MYVYGFMYVLFVYVCMYIYMDGWIYVYMCVSVLQTHTLCVSVDISKEVNGT